MAIKLVKETWSGRTGSLKDDFTRDYGRTFRVLTDDKSDGPIKAMYAAGIPRLFDPYVSFESGEVDAYSLCRLVDPRQDPINPFCWSVDCKYSMKGASQGQAPASVQDAFESPTLIPPVWKWSSESIRVPLRNAFTNPAAADAPRNKPVRNSAGMPFDPLPEIDVGFRVLDFSRIEATFDPKISAKYLYAINSDPFLGWAAGQVQCTLYDGEPQWFGATLLWKVTYRFRFIDLDFKLPLQPEVLDAGQYEFLPGKSKPSPIIDPLTRQPISRDWPLNGAGLSLTVTQINAGDAHYLPFDGYREKEFVTLSIGL